MKSYFDYLTTLIDSGDLDVLASIIESDETVELLAASGTGNNLLAYAIGNCQLDAVIMLLNHGFDPNLLVAGEPGVLFATETDNIDVVEQLLEYGADPNVRSRVSGMCALERANKDNNEKIAALLRIHGARCDDDSSNV